MMDDPMLSEDRLRERERGARAILTGIKWSDAVKATGNADLDITDFAQRVDEMTDTDAYAELARRGYVYNALSQEWYDPTNY